MKTVFIVDDNSEIRKLFTKVLKKEGVTRILTASNGEGAVKIVKKRRKGSIDLVLLDLRLPDMNGIEVLKQIKLIDKKIKVIIVSGTLSAALVVQVGKLGAFDIFGKPFDLFELQDAIKKALAANPRKQ